MKWLSLSILLLAGCSGSLELPNVSNNTKVIQVDKNYDQAWDRAVKWATSLGTPIKIMDKPSGVISTEFSLGDSFDDCIDCGEIADGLFTYTTLTDKRGSINLTVKKVTDNKTQFTLNFFPKATASILKSSLKGSTTIFQDIECNSTGVMEKKILDYLGK